MAQKIASASPEGIVYFHKSSPNVAVHVAGRPVRFTNVDYENGIIAIENPEIVKGLRELAKEGVGGVSEIGEQVYFEWRKKKPLSLPPRYREELGQSAAQTAAQLLLRQNREAPSAPVAAVESKPEPVQVPNVVRPKATK